MPFIEITTTRENVIRFKSDGKKLISKDLRDKYFCKEKVAVFLDKENKLLGLKTNDKGYKFSRYGIITCKKLLRLGLKVGYYTGEWNEKHQMVIASIELEG